EAVLKPMPKSKYETWLPKGPKVDGSDDTKGDDSSKFYVEVHDKNNPNKIYPGNFTVRYELKDITHYKGFNSNYPVYTGDKTADLKISDSTKYFWINAFDPTKCTDSVATSVVNNGSLAIVQIMCMDYGAWGKLTAKVTLDDGTELDASPYYDKGETFITIPYDRDENKIADAWEKSENILHQGYGLDWDEDVKPDNHHNGDNIPLIDEYRGFLTEDANYNAVYTRFSPQVKELLTLGLANMSATGEQFKVAIKAGALGYSNITKVKVYHFTNSRYGQKEEGSSLAYGRWVNYNSPTDVKTRGVVIYSFDTRNMTGDKNAFASTKGVSGNAPGYTGAQPPGETELVMLWTYNIVNLNETITQAKNWYLPANTDGFHLKVDPHILHINRLYNLNFDPNTFSNVVAANTPNMIQQIITFTVAHELCHATNIHHHHFSQDGEAAYAGSYQGVKNCPVRYWLDWTQEDNHADWLTLFFAGKWNPATFITPIGTPMSLCTTDDNCFNQLKLK
uniref:hypothetical protein n=1 Tax=Mucilaginibacter sp. TaxID=1882438 RepID=UPI00374DF8A3